MSESDALWHLRSGNKDCVVHVSQKDNITMDMFFENRHTVIKCMDEDGGALMMQYVGDVTPYVCYIEPTPELKRVVICNIPPAAVKSFQFLAHDGYLVMYFLGRFVRLWVDMGVQKRIHFLSDFRETLGFEKLAQISDTRALAAVPKSYVNNINFEGHYKGLGKPIQGPPYEGFSRYVSLYEAKGLVVGDLDDGNCYLATSNDIVIPCVKDKKLTLYALKKTALPPVSNVDIFHVAYEDEEPEVVEVDEEEPPVDFSVGKSLENAGNAFFDDTNKYVPREEVDLTSAPFTKAAPGPWDIRGSQDDNRDWSVKGNTVVLTRGRGGGLVTKRATARDVNGKVIKKPAAKKSKEKVFTRGGAAPRRRAPVHDEHDDMTHKYDLFSEGIRDGHKGKRRAKFEPWMEYRMGYDTGVKERKEGL